MRRATLGLLAVALLALAAGWLFRAELATAIMARGAQANLAADRIAELPDGLHVAFCGAGSPLPDPQRSGPCVAVIAGSTLVVVDAGSGGSRNLQRMGLGAGRIQAVFLTHFHSDHIDGLGELAMQRWVGAAHAEPLPVYGPPGVDQVVAGFNQAYAADFGYRTDHHGAAIAPPSGAGSRAVPFEMPSAGEQHEIWNANGLRITTFAVVHEPVHPAVGFRFEYGGRALVISGDTRKTDAVADAAEIAQTAGVKALVLYHIVPPLLVPGAEAAFLTGVNAAYDGPVTVARDGTFISMPAGTTRIEQAQRL